MKTLLYAATCLAVFGLAFWAYRENYATQQVLKDTRALQREIGAAQVRLSVLRAEWAYLNRPQRLRELAEINFDNLGLLPLRPDQFGRVDEVSYPAPPELEIENEVEVSGLNAGSQP
ncbi:cell division protein FtsL [Leisingera sp. JC1]|uniref:cell division protein FtsL n=1 Tax=Leisingera sp. JC1 TaxID=1855282 RepID=UPI000803364F|nr:cell division protein FtsL [Leisingera sp. JC1]OBY28300.1 cell division protein FtsL [Leisingera sp. JC1]